MTEPIFSVTDAVAALNQTLEAVYPTLTVVGELSDFKVAKGKWVYADIKDETSKLRLFGSVYQLTSPLEDGMMVEVIGEPRMHPLFGFSLNIRSVRPVGEGSIKKAADLLRAKLEAEGLFAPERKRPVPYGPSRIGLITSEKSAAYADFIKIMDHRWRGVDVESYDVAVQGADSPGAIIKAVNYFNQLSDMPEVLVVIRGGGSADDLAAFSTEPVVRAVAASRIPTVVAIGHEVNLSLAELAADLRASTPSNAAELLFPDRSEYKNQLDLQASALTRLIDRVLDAKLEQLALQSDRLSDIISRNLDGRCESLQRIVQLLESAHPRTSLKRGFALVQVNGKLVRSAKKLQPGQALNLSFHDGDVRTEVTRTR